STTFATEPKGSGDVFQTERTKLPECQAETAVHMIPNRAGNTNATRRTFGLEPRHHIDRVPMQIRSVRNCVADVYPNTETNSPILRLLTILNRNLLLH